MRCSPRWTVTSTPRTRLRPDWYRQNGWAESFGEADVLARARNTSVEGLAPGGVLDSKPAWLFYLQGQWIETGSLGR